MFYTSFSIKLSYFNRYLISLYLTEYLHIHDLNLVAITKSILVMKKYCTSIIHWWHGSYVGLTMWQWPLWENCFSGHCPLHGHEIHILFLHFHVEGTGTYTTGSIRQRYSLSLQTWSQWEWNLYTNWGGCGLQTSVRNSRKNFTKKFGMSQGGSEYLALSPIACLNCFSS